MGENLQFPWQKNQQFVAAEVFSSTWPPDQMSKRGNNNMMEVRTLAEDAEGTLVSGNGQVSRDKAEIQDWTMISDQNLSKLFKIMRNWVMKKMIKTARRLWEPRRSNWGMSLSERFSYHYKGLESRHLCIRAIQSKGAGQSKQILGVNAVPGWVRVKIGHPSSAQAEWNIRKNMKTIKKSMVSRGLNSCPITSHVVHVLGFRHSWCASRTCRPWDMSLGLAPSNCGVFAAVAGLWPFVFLAATANSSEIPGSCARNPETPRSNLQVCPHRLCPLKPWATSKRQPLGFGDWPIFVPWPSARSTRETWLRSYWWATLRMNMTISQNLLVLRSWVLNHARDMCMYVQKILSRSSNIHGFRMFPPLCPPATPKKIENQNLTMKFSGNLYILLLQYIVICFRIFFGGRGIWLCVCLNLQPRQSRLPPPNHSTSPLEPWLQRSCWGANLAKQCCKTLHLLYLQIDIHIIPYLSISISVQIWMQTYPIISYQHVSTRKNIINHCAIVHLYIYWLVVSTILKHIMGRIIPCVYI